MRTVEGYPRCVDLLEPLLAPLILGIDGLRWMDPQWLLDQFGSAFFWISILIVFVECGLFFPFLPGDTLLFAIGIFAASQDSVVPGPMELDLLTATVLLSLSAFAGNVVGYEFGSLLGPRLYARDGRVIKRKYLDQTEAFFDRHGNKALVIGRFVPFVRTYITVVAGVTRMGRARFMLWSGIGAVVWVLSIMLLGYFLGREFPIIGENIDYAILAILLVGAVPASIEWWRHRRQAHAQPATERRD
ncbi:VTT domain-containing protein [Nocardioidaceae bacterium]|nr:VTT domain-containing protein [Nocardioidaceae bacterium]